MKMKRFLTSLMVIVMAVTITGTALAADFSDVPASHPYKAAVDWCQAKGYVQGASATTFMPDSQLSRGQLAVIWSRFRLLHEENHTFTDIAKLKNYYDTAVILMTGLGVMKGSSDTMFSPNRSVTREELAVIAVRTFNLGATDPDAYKTYTDGDTISSWAQGSVSACINAGILAGLYDGQSFSPQTAVTRAELCKLMYNISAPSYSITIGTLEGGTITADRTSARPGEIVTLTITPDEGKQLKDGTLKYNEMLISGTSFAMPSEDVVITAEFEDEPEEESPEPSESPEPTESPAPTESPEPSESPSPSPSPEL